MKKNDTILCEIHAIRRGIDEKKDMTYSEINEYYRKSGEASAKKYGFKIIAESNKK